MMCAATIVGGGFFNCGVDGANCAADSNSIGSGMAGAIKAEAATSATMKIVAIDLGQANTGEAAMISSGSSSLLIDSGDVHNRSIFTWLDKNGYKNKRFDVYVSHWHDDHAGNTAEIIRKYHVGTLYVPTLSYMKAENTDYYKVRLQMARDCINAAKARGTKIVYLKKGLSFKVGGVSAKVLYCNGSPYSENWYGVQHINNESAVTMFTGGGVKFLSAGDIQEQAEKRILSSGVSIKADIFKLNHHGYIRSNTQKFLNAVDPTYAYFTSNSVKAGSYTSSAVSDSVSRMGKIANTFGTRYNGNVTFTCSNGEIRVSAQRNYRKMYQKLTNRSTGKTKTITTSFNKKCSIRKVSKALNLDKYKNQQVNAKGGVFTGKWKKTGSNYMLFASNSMYAVHTWIYKDKHWYYFNDAGARVTGWRTVEGLRYYMNSSGQRQTGFKTIGSNRYYFMDKRYIQYSKAKEGMRMTGWKTIGGSRYYLEDSNYSAYKSADLGKLLAGFQMIGGKRYYLANYKMAGYKAANYGKLVTGRMTVDKKQYYADGKGVLQTGWMDLAVPAKDIEDAEKRLAVVKAEDLAAAAGDAAAAGSDAGASAGSGSAAGSAAGSGSAAGGATAASAGTRKFYFGKDYALKEGFAQIDGKTYYIDGKAGMMSACDLTAEGKRWRLDENGEVIKQINCHLAEDGMPIVGWHEIGEYKYYGFADGELATGNVTIDGKDYVFASVEDGCMLISGDYPPALGEPEDEPADDENESGRGVDESVEDVDEPDQNADEAGVNDETGVDDETDADDEISADDESGRKDDEPAVDPEPNPQSDPEPNPESVPEPEPAVDPEPDPEPESGSEGVTEQPDAAGNM